MPGREREEHEALLAELSRINSELVTSQRAAYSEAADSASRREREKQYVGMIAHDLNNPLQIVHGYAQLLLADEGLSATQRAHLERIERSAELMISLVTELSDGADGSEKSGEEIVEIGLVGLVEAVVGRHQILSSHKGLRLSLVGVDPPGDPCRVRGDVVKIERVLNNLVGNAVKYSDPGGEIRVKVSASGGWATVQVQDDGPGISEQGREHIFEMFHREEETSARPGVGLGLYISRQIAEQHGGSITVDSALGKGSTFTLRLPHDAPS